MLGIDSCETTGADASPGGGATAKAEQLFLLHGSVVTLRAEPSAPDTDQAGRLLRYVALADGSDFGVQMVGYDHTGVYTDSEGRGDASQAYIDELYAHDLDYAANPPSGRDCVEYPAPSPGDDDAYVPLPDNDDGHHRKPKFCHKHWFC